MTEEFFDAIRTGDLPRVEQLLRADDSLMRARNAQKLTPVMWATYTGQGAVLASLLSRADLDIFEAAMVGRAPRVAELLDADAALRDARSVDGFTPLHFGAFFGDEGVVRLMLDRGADVNAVAQNDTRVMPLHSATAGRHLRIAGLLIAAGADVNAAQHGGVRPLHAAAHNGDIPMLDLLLASGADMAATTDEGQSAADMAAAAGHADVAARLRPPG